MADFGLALGGFDAVPRKIVMLLLKKYGIRRIEPGAYPDGLGNWVQDPFAFKKDLDSVQVRYDSVHIAREAWDISIDDESRRRAAIDAGLLSLRQAAELSAKIVVAHPNGDRTAYSEGTHDKHLARTQAALQELSDEARRLGLQIALENMMSSQRERPGITMREIKGLIAPHRDVMGICLDTGHALASGLDPAAEAVIAGSDLINVHLHDNHGEADEHLFPGAGVLNWEQLLAALRSMPYRGLLTFEVIGQGLPLSLPGKVRRLVREWTPLLDPN